MSMRMDCDQKSVDELAMLHQKILWDQLWDRQFDRIFYGHDLRYAPARHLVKPLLILSKTKIPKVEFVDIDGMLIQQEEWRRRVELLHLIRELTKRGDIYGNESLS